ALRDRSQGRHSRDVDQPHASTLPVNSYVVQIPQQDLDDLGSRLREVRWPDELSGVGWDYGVPRSYVHDLGEYWRERYDWRVHEARLNEHPQFVTVIDGQQVHFVHVRSPEPDALPLICTHGWPMSVFGLGPCRARMGDADGAPGVRALRRSRER